jgi:hypothetical protein
MSETIKAAIYISMPLGRDGYDSFMGKRHRRRLKMLGSDQAIIGAIGILILGIVVAVIVG